MSRYDVTAGPLFIGYSLSMILYGTLVVQTFFYHQASKKDRLWIRLTVLYLFAMETAITGYNMREKYADDRITFAVAAGERLRKSVTSMTNLSRMLSINAILTVRSPRNHFASWRIKLLGGPRIILAIITFTAIGSFVAGVTTSVYVPRGDEAEAVMTLGWDSNLAKSFAPEISWLALSAISDIGITGALVYTLHGKKTGFKGSDDAVTKIVRFAIETGLITTIFTLVEIALFCVAYFTFQSYYFIPDFILSKVYANTLLATLNSRNTWSKTMSTNVEFSSGMAFETNPNLSTTGNGSTRVPTSNASSHTKRLRVDAHELGPLDEADSMESSPHGVTEKSSFNNIDRV
ncbi:hypothetical protein ONZ45_g9693 [Pleurotus djamor]|nr:hypothetical protein ONZ45_g9693 [Pleurotus djamor]